LWERGFDGINMIVMMEKSARKEKNKIGVKINFKDVLLPSLKFC
jgi:hypothetical protein